MCELILDFKQMNQAALVVLLGSEISVRRRGKKCKRINCKLNEKRKLKHR